MLLLFVELAAASGWTQPRGHHYVKVGGRAIPGRDFFADSGDSFVVPRASYVDLALELYGELGLTDGWTLIGQALPIGYARFEGAGTAYSGAYQLGVRRALLRGRHRLSLQVDVGYTPPLGEVDLVAAPPPLGDEGRVYRYLPTQSGAQGDVQLGYGVGVGPVWIAAQAGAVGFTNGDIAPAAIGYAQVGYRTAKNNRWSVTLPFRQHLTSRPDTNLAGSGQTDFVGWRLEYTLTFGQSGWGVSTGVVGAAVASANEASITLPLYVEHAGGQ
ncbi:MAG: hypothetical protein AAF602_01890 [Myxococcota bacterium]